MNTYGYDNIKITSDEDLTFFHWNEKSKLWESHGKAKLGKIVSEIIAPIYFQKGNEILQQLSECKKMMKP